MARVPSRVGTRKRLKETLQATRARSTPVRLCGKPSA